MRGGFARADDVDYYVVRGGGARAATLAGDVSGVAGVDVRVVVLPPTATSGPPGPLPSGAKVFDAGGVGAGERFDGIAWPGGDADIGPYIVVERKLARVTSPTTHGRAEEREPSRGDNKTAVPSIGPAPGVDYVLSLRIKP
jgi:hypothetical protein